MSLDAQPRRLESTLRGRERALAGLGDLFGPMERWAKGLSTMLAKAQLSNAVVVGFRRYLCWAVARTRRGPFVIESPKEELTLASRDDQ